MQEKNINFGCCLDCFGSCSMVATVKDDKIIKIEGNKHHPLTQGLSPLPEYIPIRDVDENYSLRLLTPHPKNSLHSQHFAFEDGKPIAHINENTLKQQGFENNQLVKVKSKYGEIEAYILISDNVGENIIMIYEGMWHKSGSVNMLTTDEVSDIGNQTAYYECFCRLDH